MRIAIISDVHGNYPALRAVIEDARKNNVDKFIFVGDYIFDLPYANEVTELIRSLDNAYVIQGNKEEQLKNLSMEDQNTWTNEQMAMVYETYRNLTEDNFLYLTSLEKNIYIDLPFHGKIYVTHIVKDGFGEDDEIYCKSSNFKRAMEKADFSREEFLSYINNKLKDRKIIESIDMENTSVIVFGHTHLQWHGYCEDKLIINPGSCGQPLDFDSKAPYTILEDTELGIKVEERRVAYDIEEVIDFTKSTRYYELAKIWLDLVFLSLIEARDYFQEFFIIARNIAKEKNETGRFFSNETWNEAAKIFFKIK